MLTQYLTLDFTKKYSAAIEVNQYEKDGRTIAIQCTAGVLPINLTGAAVTFYAKKPDNTILYNACTITDAVTGKIEYTMTEQTCAVAGTLQCWVEIIKDDAALRSFEFTVTVRPSPDESEAIESTSEFTALEVALGTVSEYDGRIAQCEDNIETIQNDTKTIRTDVTTAQNDIGTIQAEMAALETKVETGTLTRELAAPTGTVVYAGVGFKPKLMRFVAAPSITGSAVSWGTDDGTAHTCITMRGNGDNTVFAYGSIYVGDGATWSQYGHITAIGPDSFTVSWTKFGSPPAGTLTALYDAIG